MNLHFLPSWPDAPRPPCASASTSERPQAAEGTIGDVNHASTSSRVSIRRATEADAEAIVSILEGIVSERIYSAIESAWSADEQRRYLASLSPRETFHVAETDAGAIVGYQSLDLYSTILHSMDHVAQLGTFLRPEARGRGVR